MNTFASIAVYSLPLFILILFAGQVVASEVGLWFGRRHVTGDATPEGVGVVVGSMLGLLAFALALTLSSSTSRYQDRRQSTLTEANAISSVRSRAQAVGDPRGSEIAGLLTEYTQVRVAFVEAPLDPVLLDAIERRSAMLQAQMQHLATAIAQAQPNPLTVSLLNDLDAAFGAATATRFAFAAQMMPQLFWLLLGMTLVSVGGLSYQIGLRGQTLRSLLLLIIGMWTAVITDILDLGSARIGGISTDTAVYRWVMEEPASADSVACPVVGCGGGKLAAGP